MACPATIWMVMLFPMEATCWKKMTDQYPDRPAQAARACSGTEQLPAEPLQGALDEAPAQRLTVLGHPREHYASNQPHTWTTAVSVACAPCCAGHAWRDMLHGRAPSHRPIRRKHRVVGFTIDGPCQIAVADMAMAVMPIQARQQQRCVPGHTPGQPQENDASWPAQVGECKGQRRICCKGRHIVNICKVCSSLPPSAVAMGCASQLPQQTRVTR